MRAWNWFYRGLDSFSAKPRRTSQSQLRRAFFESLEERRVLTFSTLPGGAGSSWIIADNNPTSNGLPVGGAGIVSAAGTGAGIEDASIGGQSDAFDSAAQVWVDHTIVGGTMTANAPNVAFAPSVIAGLNVSMSYYLAADSATLRVLLTLNNPTASAITAPVDYAGNFGSDDSTAVQSTSSGDTTFTNADRWIVTDDANLTGTDPANTTVLFGPGVPATTPASVSQTVFDVNGTEGVLATYDLTIPAGQTRSLMFFQKLNTTSALATSEAPTFFNANPATGSDLVAGLTNAQLARVVNWNFDLTLQNVVSEAEGPYSVNEGGSVVLSGAQSSYPGGTITNFEWDLDNNGTYETTGVSPTFSAAGIDGPATRTVGLRVTSSDGEFAFDTATVFINNVAPTVALGLSDNTISENDSTTLTGTITDPGSLDTFTLQLDWGDSLSPNNLQTFTLGATPLSVAANGIDWQPALRIFSLPHQYLDDNPSTTSSDNYAVTATVADDDSLPRVLFVSDSDTDLTIPAALGAGYDITVVTGDFANGNAALLADLSRYAAVVWSSTGSGTGDLATAAVITNLTSYVTAGGNVFVTGYDSAASPADDNLIQFVGGTTVEDTGASPTAIANLATSLTTGLVDIRNVVPTNPFGDQDALSGLAGDTVGIVASTGGFQWTLRTLGGGEIAYVSNGAVSGDPFDNWLVTAPIGDATYNAALRNFVSAAATTNPPALAATQSINVQVSNVDPVAAPQAVSTNESGPVPPINVLTGRTDVGTLDTHTAVPFSGTTAAFNVPFTVAADGSVTYNITGHFGSIPAGSFVLDSIPFTIVDDDGGTSSNNVTITINGVNDAPLLATNLGLTVPEGAAATAIASTRLQVTDVDNTAGQLVYTVTALPTNGTLALSGTPLAVNGTLTQADINGGLLTYAHNGSETVSDAFSFSVSDGAGGSIPAATFAITVTPANDPPTISDIANRTTNEDAALTAIPITVGDADTAVGSLIVTASSSDTTLFPQGSITLEGSGANRTISLSPAANLSGTATITVTVDDGAGGAASDSFTIQVTPVNDAPTLNPIANISALPISSGLQTLSLAGITAGGGESQALTVTATSSNPALIPNPSVTYTSPGSTGSLSFTPVANQSGTATITVTVTDDGGVANGGVNTFMRTFTVTVAPAITAPRFVDVVPDPENPGRGLLVINGTNSLDLITVLRVANRTLVMVPLSGVLKYFDNSSFDRVLINGLAGNDHIILDPNFPKPATINGDLGNDIILSGAGNDVIRGGAGSDVIFGRAGNDVIYGEAGADYVYGEAGNDMVLGGQDNDWLSGGSGADILNGGDGLDKIFGDGGDDLIISGNFSLANNQTELLAIQTIWTSTQSFTTRVNGLASRVNATTVTSDGKFDWVYTGAGRDWVVDYALMDLLFDFNFNATNGDKRN